MKCTELPLFGSGADEYTRTAQDPLLSSLLPLLVCQLLLLMSHQGRVQAV
jgi:hypothetical protein